jgi:hypothetical protein
VRLHEGHAGRDAAEQEPVGLRVDRRGSRCRRRCAVPAGQAVGVELAQATDEWEVLEQRLRARLEESPPLRVHRLGSGKIVGEELLDEAGVQIVNLVAFHALE